MTAPEHLQVTKHHGLGNDFLVWLAPTPELAARIDLAELARRTCARHRGVGADGLIIATSPDADDRVDAVMVLHNADGSRAEMSGNGIRCLAQALVRARGATDEDLRIATDAGERRLSVRSDPDGDAATVWVRVDMGPVRPGREPAPGPAAGDLTTAYTKAVSLELGNPHLVLLVDDAASVDPAEDGPRWEQRFPEGCNVHFVTAGDPQQITLRTWERGAGATEACGTGAVAAAAAVNGWGLGAEEIRVDMLGGSVTVHLGATAVLDGPATWIADATIARPPTIGTTR